MPAFSARGFATLAPKIVAQFLAISALFVTDALAACQDGLGVARTVEIDTASGPLFGSITKQTRENSFLSAKEVVLTFDDGPMPGVTKSVLDTLDRFCTKATFFSVGQMAVAYPELVREVMRRGHTLGTHTWSHPMNLRRLKGDQARDQIEIGFAAVALAAGQPIAPFFRFPGLNDSPGLLAHLESRDIATFTVDVVSNDSYIHDPGKLIERTLRQVEIEHGGIMLFHDIKPQTARALPVILSELKARGYRVVHMRAKATFKPDERYAAAIRERLAAKQPAALHKLIAITDGAATPALAPVPAAQISIAPEPSDGAVAAHVPAQAADGLTRTATRRQPPADAAPATVPASLAVPASVPAEKAAASTAEPLDQLTYKGRRRRDVQMRAAQPPNASEDLPAAGKPALPVAAPSGAGVPVTLAEPAKAAENSDRPTSSRQPRIINAAPQAGQTPAMTTAPEPVAQLSAVPAAKADDPKPADKDPPHQASVPGAQSAAPAVTASAKPARLPAAAGNAAAPAAPASSASAGVEVIAGTYGSPAPTTPAGMPQAGRFASPEIIAGSYRKQPAAVPQDGSKLWQDVLKDRTKDGN